ncbi:MAG: putative LPS assembly protein LptD [Longimicrobiales bacterium]
MDGQQLARRADATRRREGGPSDCILPPAALPALALALLLALLLAPAGLAAQQDTTRTARDTARADTTAQDTAARDTTPPDTTLTPRQRALQRLRTLPMTPVQPDTTDSLAMDSLAVDSLAVDSLVVDSLAVDSLAPGAAGDSAAAGAVDTTRAGQDVVVDSGPPELPGRLAPIPPDTGRIRPGEREGIEQRPARRPREDVATMEEAAVRERLEALEGYESTEYRGEGAVFWADSNQLRLTGDARIAREGNALETDSLLVYDGGTDVVCGYGSPVLSGEDEPVTSDRVCFDIERDVGMAESARTRFTRQATWYVLGANNRVFLLDEGEKSTLYGERTEFTSCDLEHPHYTFRARSLKMVDGGMMVARDVTLQFEDVPVFWLPWMISPTNRGRRSGLLMPQFGVNDIVRNNAGYSRQISNVGFYWAINDYVSARGTFDWWSGNWTAVEGALTYYWRRQFLQGSLNAKHYWRQREGVPAGREFTLNTTNSWRPDERTRLQMNARYASSADFVRQNSFDPRELNQSIRSSASANRSFDWGSMTLGAERQQQLSTEQVDMTLPSLQLSLSPMTLYNSEGAGWDVTWRGSGSADRKTRDVLEAEVPGVRDSETVQTRLNQSISLGRLSLGQNLSYQKETLGPKPSLETVRHPLSSQIEDFTAAPFPALPDEPLEEETGETLGWGVSLGFQQNLWTGTTLSPNVSMNGNRVRNAQTRLWNDSLDAGGTEDFIAQPLRFSAGANLTTALYGFFPGFARFSRIRHKIAPTLRWSYSPKPTITALQDSVFGGRSLRARNTLTLSFSQTFEAKVESDDEEAAADSAELGQPGEPRRLPQDEKITLLALNTSTPFVYDFVAAREDGRGFQTTQISNSIRSDLVQGLQLSTSHSLFETGERPEDGDLAPRTFAPFLTNLSASFNIDNEFWLFRFLGLSGGTASTAGTEQAQDTASQEQESDRMAMGAESGSGRGGDMGGVVPGDHGGDMGPRGGGNVGTWRAALSYSLERRRATSITEGTDNQVVRANITFDPTQHWSVRWTTSYSFTDSQFADHILTLSRDLHRWTANFDFLKTRTGNFQFQFRVQLRDQPDLKLDYDQQQRGTEGLEDRRPTGGPR